MPGTPIRTQANKDGLNPPSEKQVVPRGEVAMIGLDGLTAGQRLVVESKDWK